MLETGVASAPAPHQSYSQLKTASPMTNGEKKIGRVLGTRSGVSLAPFLVLVPRSLGEPTGQAQTKRRVRPLAIASAADLPQVLKLRQPPMSDECSPEANELLGAGAVWLGGSPSG